jgi:hypothetical protein
MLGQGMGADARESTLVPRGLSALRSLNGF